MTATHSWCPRTLDAERVEPVTSARCYFALQAVAGAAWWLAVWMSSDIQYWTLGHWNPAGLVGPDLAMFVGASAATALSGNRIAATIAAVWTTAVTVALSIYGLAERAAGWGVVLMTLATLGTIAATATVQHGHLPTAWFFVGPFSFRVADPASSTHHLRRSLAQLVAFWTTFFFVVPFALAAIEMRLHLDWDAFDRVSVRVVGLASFTLGSALGVWACVTMAVRGNGTPLPAETARDLVIAGPYRRVRNPMALAGTLQTIGVGLAVGSWMVIAAAVAGALVWNVLIRPVEEAELAARFGTPYRRYVDEVRCWTPVCPPSG